MSYIVPCFFHSILYDESILISLKIIKKNFFYRHNTPGCHNLFIIGYFRSSSFSSLSLTFFIICSFVCVVITDGFRLAALLVPGTTSRMLRIGSWGLSPPSTHPTGPLPQRECYFSGLLPFLAPDPPQGHGRVPWLISHVWVSGSRDSQPRPSRRLQAPCVSKSPTSAPDPRRWICSFRNSPKQTAALYPHSQATGDFQPCICIIEVPHLSPCRGRGLERRSEGWRGPTGETPELVPYPTSQEACGTAPHSRLLSPPGTPFRWTCSLQLAVPGSGWEGGLGSSRSPAACVLCQCVTSTHDPATLRAHAHPPPGPSHSPSFLKIFFY